MPYAEHAEASLDRHWMEEILRSKSFERTRGLRKLLEYLWANRDDEISEYAIAIDALGRGSDFDSRVDATVRVQIGRLRRQLDRYYETEGQTAARRVTIPLGSHFLEFIDVDPARERDCVLPVESGTSAPNGISDGFAGTELVSRSRWPFWVISAAAIVLCGFLTAAATLFLMREHPGAHATVAQQTASPFFWKQFFDNEKPTRIVLPAPLFFSWNPKGGDTLMVRDISVNKFDHAQSSAELARIEQRLGKPGRWQQYTVASDTFAALKLARFLDKYGIQTNFSSSEDAPQEITDHENIVAFGTVTSLITFHSDLERLSFRLGPHERYVIDTRLPAGSPPLFPLTLEPNKRMIMPGIVALLPRDFSGSGNGSRILLIQGEQTIALITWLMSDEGMKELVCGMQHAKSPYFEAVVLSEVNGTNPIQSRLAAFRPFSPQPVGPEAASVASSAGSAPSLPGRNR